MHWKSRVFAAVVGCFTTLWLFAAESRSQNPPVIELGLHPIAPTSTVPGFSPVVRKAPNEDVSRKHREAMLLAFKVLVERNEDPVFHEMLQKQPSHLDKEGCIAWMDYMQSRFKKPIAMAIETHDLGAYQTPSSILEEEVQRTTLAINGGQILGEHLLGSVLLEMEMDSPETVLSRLPLVLSIIEDWCKSCDIPVIGTSNQLEKLLESILAREDSPDLAIALSTLESPFKAIGGFHRNHPEVWQIPHHIDAAWVERCLSTETDDGEVIEKCRLMLAKTYAALVKNGDKRIEKINNFDEWMNRLQGNSQANRKILQEHGIQFSSNASTERLAVAAGIVRFRDFANWIQRLHEGAIPQAIDRFKKERDSIYPPRIHRTKNMCDVSSGLIEWTVQPTDYWFSQQSIMATSFLFSLRQHLGKHGEFPSSLDALEPLPVPRDPVHGKPWDYMRISPKEAQLRLASIDGGVRKDYRLKMVGK